MNSWKNSRILGEGTLRPDGEEWGKGGGFGLERKSYVKERRVKPKRGVILFKGFGCPAENALRGSSTVRHGKGVRTVYWRK